jgi:hypothetical protein
MVIDFIRRICPGRHLAHSTVFAVVASLLHSFNILGIGTVTEEYESLLQKYVYLCLSSIWSESDTDSTVNLHHSNARLDHALHDTKSWFDRPRRM